MEEKENEMRGQNDLEKRLIQTRLGHHHKGMYMGGGGKVWQDEVGDRDTKINLLFFTALQRGQRSQFS